MVEWIDLKDKQPEDRTGQYLVGRSPKAGVPAAQAAYYWDGKFMVPTVGTMLEFKSPTHWAVFPKPPSDDLEEIKEKELKP